ncbi:MAG: glycine cleavage system protein GcvH [Saccharopolyspora sp.]|uniref:glycine cleavage system protein GcvH n=1 Tax=Saccharopolyspora TaxID=1835 RepID=UPI00190D7306|nr:MULTISPECIES: glycine cleavage system protein GcvH [unclassified Saccharopolyspora]MBK0868052.1 glycine cleavage system protein GcvH [Saccharopolyspora sp. HNM0986]MBQ6643111.1 glycine cleavage system protein GcvH [Saccharopolyspora sp.]
MAPEGIKYTEDHEWVLRTGEDTVRVGITDYAQQQLGDVVFVQLPDAGEAVQAGGGIGEVESTKSVSDIYAPVAGEVVARNERLDEQPELVNSAPFGDGWMLEIKLADPAAPDALLGPEDYQAVIDQA